MLLTELFVDAVVRHPERVAVEVPPGRGRPERQTATYAELAHMGALVAQRLAPLVGQGSVVALLLPRDCMQLYAAQLGVLLAGAAHVCLDLSFPDAHVEHVLRDAGAVALLTDA